MQSAVHFNLGAIRCGYIVNAPGVAHSALDPHCQGIRVFGQYAPLRITYEAREGPNPAIKDAVFTEAAIVCVDECLGGVDRPRFYDAIFIYTQGIRHSRTTVFSTQRGHFLLLCLGHYGDAV